MNKYLFLFLPLILTLVSCVNRTPRFTDYLKNDSNSMAIIEEQNKHDGSKKNNQDTLAEQMALVEVMLNQTVWNRMSELPKEPDYSDLESILKKHGWRGFHTV